MEKELVSDGKGAAVFADESSPPTGDFCGGGDGGDGGGGGGGGGNGGGDDEADDHENAAAVEVDVSGKKWEMPLLELSSPQCSLGEERNPGSLYVFNNAFSLVPSSIGRLNRLKILKFFGNEIDVLPPEAGNLVELESLQVKVSWPGLSGIPFGKLQSLKELELCNVPTRASAFSVLTEIACLSCLRKLSVCYLSIRYLPPEIGRLKNLEELDLSFNKLTSLPSDLHELSALRALNVASNKLVNLPSGLSSLPRLENLDLSNNRLTSLASLELSSMRTLQYLNLQYNKLDRDLQVPSWIHCILEENGHGTCEESEASVHSRELSDADTCQIGMGCSCNAKKMRMKCIPEEAGEYPSEESNPTVICRELSDVDIRQMGISCMCNDSQCSSSTSSSEAPCFGRCNATKRTRKKWKRWNYFQHMARLERLNHSRKCQNSSRTLKSSEHNKLCDPSLSEKGCMEIYSEVDREIQPHCLLEQSSLSEKLPVSEDLNGESLNFIGENDSLVLPRHTDDGKVCSHVTNSGDSSSCVTSDCAGLHGFSDGEAEVASPSPSAAGFPKLKVHDEGSSAEESKNSLNSKRHYDDDLVDIDNPKRKCHRAFGGCTCLSCKYSIESFCGIDDHLPDGFYDAGRNRRCLPLCNYEQILCLDSREVILLDREKDEELDAILLTAKKLLSMLKRPNNFGEQAGLVVDDLHRASMLALFVSDCFGGSDRSCSVLRMRHSALGSCEQRPFVCTCTTGNNYNVKEGSSQICGLTGNINFTDLCDKSLRLTKESRKSVIVPIGAVRFGVCRHRAVLMKYLCDRAEPPIPCELVRGYLDFMPHAWNAVLIRQGCSSWTRMIVDACNPTDIREETDPEYFCRYIPLSRVYVMQQNANGPGIGCSFPSLSPFPKSGKSSVAAVKRVKFGTCTAAAKVRNLETYGASEEDIKIFEYTFLGEVRMLGALRKHKCIVEIYGHHLSSTWVTAIDGKDHRVLQSSIIMEYIEGGSLKNYLRELSESGEKHVPLNLALYIARDVACALATVHSKQIIHRDIKSENILIDLDDSINDGVPIVKLCDFDRAVPLHSFLHSCCIAHIGIHPPNTCVGTPLWMAPEVLSAMHDSTPYGLEVDIWSYGCLILELLTRKMPYEDLPPGEIQDCLERKQRPPLTPELEELFLTDEEAAGACSRLGLSYVDADIKTLKLLIDLFYRCTRPNPAERPTAGQIYDVLCSCGTAAPDDES